MNKRSLPDGWSLKKIGEIATVVSGGTPSRNQPKYWVNGNIPWVTPTDITRDNSLILSEAKEKITELGLRSSSANLLPSGTLLMTSRATVGEIKISSVPVSTNQGFKNLIPNALVDKWYLYYQMVFHKESYKQLGNGSTFLEVSKSATESFEIYYAPLPEQRAIADILFTLDKAIAQSESLVQKYQSIRQGLMSDLLMRGVDENGELRPSYEEKPSLYKNSDMGWIPKSWSCSELRAFLARITYGFTNPMPTTEDGPYMVTAANVFGGKIQYDTCRHTSQNAYQDLLTDKSRPKLGDVLITKDGSLGRLAIVDRDDICINQSVALMRARNIHSEFLKYLLESPGYQDKIIGDAGGSTIRHIYVSKIDKMLVAVPTEEKEQRYITEIVKNISSILIEEETQIRKLQKMKAGLMQDLLSGQVRVKV